jgi:hypothetical protein
VSKKYQEAAAAYETGIDTAIVEYNKATTGKPITVDERKHWREKISTVTSPDAAHAMYKSFMEYVAGRMTETANKYNIGMDIPPEDKKYKTVEKLLSPMALSEYRRISGMPSSSLQQPSPDSGHPDGTIRQNNRTGERQIMRGGQWQTIGQ